MNFVNNSAPARFDRLTSRLARPIQLTPNRRNFLTMVLVLMAMLCVVLAFPRQPWRLQAGNLDVDLQSWLFFVYAGIVWYSFRTIIKLHTEVDEASIPSVPVDTRPQ